MTFVRDLKLSYKFASAFGIICALSVLQGVAALIGLSRIDSISTHLTTTTHVALEQTSEIRQQMQAARRMELAMLLCVDQKCTDAYMDRRNTALEKYGVAREHLLSLKVPDERLREFHSADDIFSRYKSGSDSIVQNFSQQEHKDPTGLGSQEQQLLALFNLASNGMDQVGQKFAEASRGDSTYLANTNAAMRWGIICVMVLVTALGVGTGLVLTRLIAPPIKQVTAALESVAEKDLTIQLDFNADDEVGRLANALNVSVRSVRDVLSAVAKGADHLASTSHEISSNSVQSSANANQQTRATEHIAAAAIEMTATIGEISQNAEAATVASQTSARMAEEGGAVMQAAATTMETISRVTASVAEKLSALEDRSDEIGRIAGVIGEISEQTNMLALNAAIEAARAGEHGRGFAVVAEEVRRLAERTKSATEKIADTIKNIQSGTAEALSAMEKSRVAVEAGLGETAQARKSMDSIIEASRQVDRQIAMIATAATEQTAASGEISESAGKISEWTSENARGAERAVAATKNLAVLADDLDSMIQQFQFEGTAA